MTQQQTAALRQAPLKRGLGILLPIFSLPSSYGIGTFGKEAYRFVDYLKRHKIKYWQILPLGQTGYGDSPYSSFSSFAGNPYFIDLELLCEEGLLEAPELDTVFFGEVPTRIDYAALYQNRYSVLYQAYLRFCLTSLSELREFENQEKAWIWDYAFFMAIKKEYQDASWWEWPNELRLHDKQALEDFKAANLRQVEFYCFLQLLFFKQWKALKFYAEESGVRIIGDMPIYVARDSVDVWANREDFLLDEDLQPRIMAGVPPDVYSSTGQLWGNPIYDWEKMKQNGYAYWLARVQAQFHLFHILRLDHFIGFANYWAVPGKAETAKNGQWMAGPGLDLFLALERKLGALPILVENLGILSEDVILLREKTGFPGMNPLQFAFSEENSPYLPHHYDKRTSCYTSTHDSDTIYGWWKSLEDSQKARARAYFALSEGQDEVWGVMRAAVASVADICILQMQDVLGYGSEARINIPGQIGNNWKWRLCSDYENDENILRIKDWIRIYGRD